MTPSRSKSIVNVKSTILDLCLLLVMTEKKRGNVDEKDINRKKEKRKKNRTRPRVYNQWLLFLAYLSSKSHR